MLIENIILDQKKKKKKPLFSVNLILNFLKYLENDKKKCFQQNKKKKSFNN